MKEPDPIQLKAFYEKHKAVCYASGHGDCWDTWAMLNDRIIERDKRIAALEAAARDVVDERLNYTNRTMGQTMLTLIDKLAALLPGRNE